jgi:cytochrome c-type biogenesis protein CcmE
MAVREKVTDQGIAKLVVRVREVALVMALVLALVMALVLGQVRQVALVLVINPDEIQRSQQGRERQDKQFQGMKATPILQRVVLAPVIQVFAAILNRNILTEFDGKA